MFRVLEFWCLGFRVSGIGFGVSIYVVFSGWDSLRPSWSVVETSRSLC